MGVKAREKVGVLKRRFAEKHDILLKVDRLQISFGGAVLTDDSTWEAEGVEQDAQVEMLGSVEALCEEIIQDAEREKQRQLELERERRAKRDADQARHERNPQSKVEHLEW